MSSLNKSCRKCGKTYIRPKGLSDKQWKSRRFCSRRCAALGEVSHELVCEMYKSGLSSRDVAKAVGISFVHAARIVKKAGLTRDASTRVKMGLSKPEVREKMSIAARRPCPESVKEKLRLKVGPKSPFWKGGLTMSAGGYLVFTKSKGNGENAGRALHSVIAEESAGRKVMPNEHVHHIDENKLNNHPDNLQIMTASEHARLHAIKNKLGKRSDAKQV